MADRNGNDPARAGRRAVDPDPAVRLSEVARQMRAASLQRLLQLAEKHPNETLTIIRGWMQEHG